MSVVNAAGARTSGSVSTPFGNRIELFARKAAEGWARWGNAPDCQSEAQGHGLNSAVAARGPKTRIVAGIEPLDARLGHGAPAIEAREQIYQFGVREGLRGHGPAGPRLFRATK